MEAKSKIIISVLIVSLCVIVFACWYGKPKKYDKKKMEENRQKQENEKTPVIVNNNIDTEALAETIRNFTPKRIEAKDIVVEKITAEDCADRLYNAMIGHGTDNRALLQCFDYIDDDNEFDDVMEVFESKYEEPFDAVLGREMFSGKILAKKINEMLAERNIERIITIE